MYRDERSAVLARLEAARDRRDQTLREIDERRSAMQALNEQLEAKGLHTAQIAAAPNVTELAPAVAELPLAEQIRLCDVLELEAAALERQRDQMASTISLMNDRVLGRSAIEPLGPPPRPVPISYFFAEFATWYGFFACAIAALAIRCGVSVYFLGPIALVLLLTTFRPWALEFRFLSVMIAVFFVGGALAVLSMDLSNVAKLADHAQTLLALLVLGVVTVDLFHALQRADFFARAKVATTKLIESKPTSTYFRSWPLAVGHGWRAGVENYSGPQIRSVVAYFTEDGHEGQLVRTGAEWQDAVVLYDPARPERAYAIFDFGCSPRPVFDGSWSGELGIATYVRMLLVGAAFIAFLFSVVTR